ncbi:FadR/GntR family transcriptional regulator [Novosphingobium profundi]|uniref:FadR/GntR family transcriptional regulator n=1 Tax=Novosphingobium profundi TaxID=1774954 RepID=UPI001BDA4B50|nr:FadR/GntR family transcriptional regulator [Novosphingobium profundi]
MPEADRAREASGLGGKSEKLYRKVIDAVQQGIDAGAYPVGTRLPSEREIAEENSVSRTTVREAMVALEMLGVVEMRKGSGIYVVDGMPIRASASELDVGAFELIEARRLLEGEIAGLAAHFASDAQLERLAELLEAMEDPDEIKGEQADREFHQVIAEASGNGALEAVVRDLWDMRERAPLARSILHRARGLGLGARVDEHRAILEALRARDALAARQAMRAHLERVIDHLLAMTENDDIAAAKSRSAALRKRAAIHFG